MKHPYYQYLMILFFLVLTQSPTQAQEIIMPDNMYADSTNLAFPYGVTSGDPLPNAVIIWTRIATPPVTVLSIPVTWEMALNEDFADIVLSGNFETNPTRDWTIKVDAIGLQPYTTYYYRFVDSEGNISQTGRTKTAPEANDNIDEIKVAVASCSSVYSGYFNAYKRIAERNDLDLMIHVGDYLYDFVDGDEQVRVPTPTPTVPNSLEEWRERHKYYLLDPDLRAARQQHPWIVLWDNHDISHNNPDLILASIQAFMEYVPVRAPDLEEPKNIYRSFNYGNLLDVVIIDILVHRDQDMQGDEWSVLGLEQYDWLLNTLENSDAKWRVIGNQKQMAGWNVDGVPDVFPIEFDGPVADSTSWDGYNAERVLIYDFLTNNNINNNLVVTGDLHISMASDLTATPLDTLTYNETTGEGSVGVEFLPTSISRGNLDEQGISPDINDFVVDLDKFYNPNRVYAEFIQHGYGLLHIKPDSVIAQIWYSPILEISEEEILGVELVMRDAENHWVHPQISTQIAAIEKESEGMELYPNPTKDALNISFKEKLNSNYNVEIWSLDGRLLMQQKVNNNLDKLTLTLGNLPKGNYYVLIHTATTKMAKSFVKE